VSLIEENRKLVPDWGRQAWNKAVAKGLITSKTKFTDVMTKGEWFVLKDRAGEL